MTGLYLHIPFCKSRCIYCGFYSTVRHNLMRPYVDGMIREMSLRPLPANEAVGTIYLGGGTPSQLPSDLLANLFYNIYKVYRVADKAEVTMECNPDDVDDDFVAALADLPVNRISMGAQTFSDQRLRFLHRRHTARQVGEAVERLRRGGIGNISIDLMFGFPGETLAEWENDIAAATSLGVEHISAYSLMYEEGTPLYDRKMKDPRLHIVDEETERQMYETLIDRLTAAGFEHYEISNFARFGDTTEPDRQTKANSWRSQHNSSYWNGTPYIGIGAAAHSYNIRTRSWNVADIDLYISRLLSGNLPVEGSEIIDEATRYNDIVTTALRTRDGIDLSNLPSSATDFRSYLLSNAETHLRSGMLQITNGRIQLTRQGLFVSDDIMSDLIYV